MKVYSSPIEAPVYDIDKSRDDNIKAEKEFKKDLEKYGRENGFNRKNTGRILRVPFADSYAEYMFFEGSRSFLIVLPLGDCWNDPNVKYLPKKEVLSRMDAADKFNAMWENEK